jgi:competence protein ComEC
MKDRVIYAVLLGFVFGILLHSFFSFGWALMGVFFLICFALFLYSAVLRNKNKTVLLCAVFLVSFSCGLVRYEIHEMSLRNASLEKNISKTVLLEGVIIREPVFKESNAQLLVRVDSLRGESIHVSRILVLTDRYPEYAYGQRIRLEGKIDHPKNFETNGKIVDYISYLKGEGVLYILYRPKISILGSGGSKALSLLYKTKNAFIKNIEKSIPEPESTLLDGILLGSRTLSPHLSQTFQTVGIVHIIALSGFNISLVGDFFVRLFAFMPLRRRLAFSSIFIVLFTIMTGGSSTAVRALIMALLVILGRGWGRIYDAGRALLVAGFLMIAVSPTILIYDVSFQLSFLATFGLIHFSPLFIEKMRFITLRFKLRDVVATTLATQALVLPLLLYKTGILSFVSLPVNLLILPVIPVLMVLGFFLGIVGFVAQSIALPFAYISYALLWYIISLAELFAKIPFGSVRFTAFPLWLSLSLYIVLALLFIGRLRKKAITLTKDTIMVKYSESKAAKTTA